MLHLTPVCNTGLRVISVKLYSLPHSGPNAIVYPLRLGKPEISVTSVQFVCLALILKQQWCVCIHEAINLPKPSNPKTVLTVVWFGRVLYSVFRIGMYLQSADIIWLTWSLKNEDMTIWPTGGQKKKELERSMAQTEEPQPGLSTQLDLMKES